MRLEVGCGRELLVADGARVGTLACGENTVMVTVIMLSATGGYGNDYINGRDTVMITFTGGNNETRLS